MKITLKNHNQDSHYQQAVIHVLTKQCLLDETQFVSQSELAHIGFSHPLLSENVFISPNNVYKIEYGNLDEFFVIARAIYAVLLAVDDPKACLFEINPSARLREEHADLYVPFSISCRKKARKQISITQLEQIVSHFRGAQFQYQNMFLLEQQITMESLPEAVDGDLLYQADPDVLAFCQREDRFNDFEIRYINHHLGLGVYARNKILKDDMIACYYGLKRPKGLPDVVYTYYGKTDLLNLNVDARSHGNIARFVNHSEKSSLLQDKHCLSSNVAGVLYQIYGNDVIIFVARRDILPNEQLLVHYGERYFSDPNDIVIWWRDGSMTRAAGEKIPLDSRRERRKFLNTIATYGVIHPVLSWRVGVVLAIVALGLLFSAMTHVEVTL